MFFRNWHYMLQAMESVCVKKDLWTADQPPYRSETRALYYWWLQLESESPHEGAHSLPYLFIIAPHHLFLMGKIALRLLSDAHKYKILLKGQKKQKKPNQTGFGVGKVSFCYFWLFAWLFLCFSLCYVFLNRIYWFFIVFCHFIDGTPSLSDPKNTLQLIQQWKHNH